MPSQPPALDLEYARSFHELVVYQKARALQKMVYDSSLSFSPEERHGLTDQCRRAARSIGAQIAEAWGKRAYPRHFVSKLTDADAEQQETQHWLITAVDAGQLTRDAAIPIFQLCVEIGRMLGKMIQRHHDFCRPVHSSLQESSDVFFIPSNRGPHPFTSLESTPLPATYISSY